MSQVKEPPQRIQELDVLRGVAALVIFFFHCTLCRSEAYPLLKLGVTGVDLFFMISGFVIYLTISHTSHCKNFVINRLARLYPAYWTCVTVTAILILLQGWYFKGSFSDITTDFLGNLTMIQSYLGIRNLDEQYWTLVIELLFYLTIFVIYVSRKMESMEVIGYAVLFFVLMYDLFIEKYFGGVYLFINENFALINHFPLFFAGILFYKIKIDRGNYARYLGVFCCFILTIMLFNNGGRSRFYISVGEYSWMVLIYFALFIGVVNDRLKFIISKPLLFLGRISYSFYLIHQYVSAKVVIPILQKYFNFKFFPAVFVALLVSILMATAITLYIEEPSLKRCRRLFSAKS
jgi:peptidoglycan/LPS O-acetylase OafA/YrhL